MSGGCIKSEIFPLQWDSGNCLPRREVNADGRMDIWKHGEMDGGVKWVEGVDGFRDGRRVRLREGRCVEVGWIGGEHQRDRERREGGMEEMAELSV